VSVSFISHYSIPWRDKTVNACSYNWRVTCGVSSSGRFLALLLSTSFIIHYLIGRSHENSRKHESIISPNRTGRITELWTRTQVYVNSRALLEFLPARRYASAGRPTSYCPVSVSVCLSVCLSQVGVLSKWMDGPNWFLACRLFSTFATLSYKEIRLSPKIRALPSKTFSWTPDLENFANAYRSSKRIIDLARERWTLRAS